MRRSSGSVQSPLSMSEPFPKTHNWFYDINSCSTEPVSASVFPAETDSSCKVCCRSSSGACAPYQNESGDFLFLRKGKPCTVGFCDGAVRLNHRLKSSCWSQRVIMWGGCCLCRGNAWSRCRTWWSDCGSSSRNWTSTRLGSFWLITSWLLWWRSLCCSGFLSASWSTVWSVSSEQQYQYQNTPKLLVKYQLKIKLNGWMIRTVRLVGFFHFQDKKMDKQYEQTTKSLFFPSVSV